MRSFRLLAMLLALFATVPPAGASAAEAFQVTRTGKAGARPLLLIHGLLASAATFDDTVKRLAGSYDLHVVQIAGFAGLAPVSDGKPVMTSTAAALAAYLQKSDLKGVVVIGHSMGGQIALQVAAAAPDRVAAAVILDSLPFVAGVFTPGLTPEAAAERAKALRVIPPEQFQQMTKGGLARQSKDPAYVAKVGEWAAASDTPTAISAFAEMMGADWRPDMAKVTQQVLVLHAWDPVMPAPKAVFQAVYRDQYSKAPKVQIETIENSLHFLMHDQPDAYAAALVKFLDALPPR